MTGEVRNYFSLFLKIKQNFDKCENRYWNLRFPTDPWAIYLKKYIDLILFARTVSPRNYHFMRVHV